MKFRDFRTSALAMGLMMLVLVSTAMVILWLAGVNFDSFGMGAIVGGAVGAYGGAMMKLSDDGGETDVIKAIRMFLTKD